MELLAREEGWLTKASCGRWWHGASERHYFLHPPASQVVSSPSAETNQVQAYYRTGVYIFVNVLSHCLYIA